MAILTIAERDTYLSEFSNSDDAALASAIAIAQGIAEGPQGANRPLDLSQVTEVLNIPSSNIILPSRLPISEDGPTTLQVRGRAVGSASFGRFDRNVTTEWITIPADGFEIDYELGEIRITQLALSNSSSYPGSIYSRSHRPLSRVDNLQARITYTAGFDFSDDSNPVVVLLKRMLAAIVLYRDAASAALSGMKAYQVENFYKVDFSTDKATALTSAIASSPMDEFLLIFRRFRPRGVA